MSAGDRAVGPRELGRPAAVEEIVVLAAAGRAALHERTPGRLGKAGLGTISAHLGWVHDGWATRILRPHLASLVARGLLAASVQRRTPLWELTERGRTFLGRWPGPKLPESPQHRLWRHDRLVAAAELATLRGRLEQAAADLRHLVSQAPLRSDALREVGGRLAGDLGGLSAAIDVLENWPEPADARPDDGKPFGAGALYLHVDRKRREELIHAAADQDRP